MVVNQSAAAKSAIDARRDALAEAITVRCFDSRPELAVRYGPVGREKCLQDTLYHLRYLAEAVGAGSPALFFDYVAWAKVLLASVRVPARDLVYNLEVLRDTLREQLPPEAAAVSAAFVDEGLRALPGMPAELPSFLGPTSPHSSLAREYLHVLLEANRAAASRLILNAVNGGATVRDIYRHVFEPCQREIGRLWQTNQISVAQEHYCTAATQLIMSQLYPHLFGTERNGLRMVATCVGSELHEIGVRMVADFFEMEGWDTFYLGANVPASSIVRSLRDKSIHLLAISATMTFHIDAVAQLIRLVRGTPDVAHVKILVGGYPFNVDRSLWQRVGADGSARNADETIELARQWSYP